MSRRARVPKVGECYEETSKPKAGRDLFVYKVDAVLPRTADAPRRLRLINTDRDVPLDVREVSTKEFGLSRMRSVGGSRKRVRDWQQVELPKRR